MAKAKKAKPKKAAKKTVAKKTVAKKPAAKKSAAKKVATKAAAKPAKRPAKTPTVATPPAAPVIVSVAPTAVPVPVTIPAAPAAPAAAAPAKGKKAGKPPSIEKQRKDLLEQKTVDELKAMLKANEQITTGNRGELVKRVLDCVEHGGMPRCPQCGLGRIKVSKWSGFYCPGGYDDDEYMACDFKATEIERPAWKFETPGGLV